MADEKISQLSDAGAPQDTDQLVIARSGSSLSLLFSALKAAIPGGVTSVFTRTGAVTAQTGDYTAAQVGALPSTETLDQIATANVTAANWSNNSHKITSLANGSGAQDAAAFGQIPTALPPNGTAGGDLSGTYPNPAVKAITETSGPTDLTFGTIADGQFVKRSGTTLVSAAAGTGTVTSVTSADTSISVATTTTTPVMTVAALNTIAANHATSGSIAMNTNKLTGLSAGSGAGDSLRYEQVIGANVLAVANLVAGTAGQVLGGTGPSYAFPPGWEFDYATMTSPLTVTATTAAGAQSVCDGAAVTYDGSTRVKIEFFAPDTVVGTAGNLIFELWDGSTDLGLLCVMKGISSDNLANYGVTFLTPSNAAHTYHVKVWKSGATGTFTVNAGAAFSGSAPTADPPAFLRITKA